ncbi:MAG: nucleotidyl transferase AbiEii/AbiGii toxin family protein [Bacteroidia bacterium]|nr:nucleotidyl transferase AbiEii/AbiGii toxin family protein [Bacteroidia bacterium]
MLNRNIHYTKLVMILKDIYSDIELSSILGFKGGTACYLFHGLPRFSTDLDFDLLDHSQELEVLTKIERILNFYGKTKECISKRYSLFLLLSYENQLHNIKIEISKRDFGASYKIMNYLGIMVKVMQEKDLFANKLCALSERKTIAPRDLFDIWFFLKNNWEINKTIIEKRTKLSLEDYITQCISLIEQFNEKWILAGIGDLLDENTKIWTRNNLKNDLVFLLKIYR